MDKPHFIRGLLAEVGTAIDPVQLVRRIPEGLEIEGLRDGIHRMVREYEIQYSISEGVAKVLRGEVATGMDMLRAGRKRGIKFEVLPCDDTPSVTLEKQKTGLSEKEKQGKKVDIETKGVDAPTSAKLHKDRDETTTTAPSSNTNAVTNFQPDPAPPTGDAPPGHCTGCHRPFTLPTAEEEALTEGPVPPSRDTLVGFACGHVFHLSCLLPKTSASASVAATLQQQLANDAENSGRWMRSVGAKVAHAHVIKRAVGAGCVVCRERDALMTEEE